MVSGQVTAHWPCLNSCHTWIQVFSYVLPRGRGMVGEVNACFLGQNPILVKKDKYSAVTGLQLIASKILFLSWEPFFKVGHAVRPVSAQKDNCISDICLSVISCSVQLWHWGQIPHFFITSGKDFLTSCLLAKERPARGSSVTRLRACAHLPSKIDLASRQASTDHTPTTTLTNQPLRPATQTWPLGSADTLSYIGHSSLWNSIEVTFSSFLPVVTQFCNWVTSFTLTAECMNHSRSWQNRPFSLSWSLIDVIWIESRTDREEDKLLTAHTMCVGHNCDWMTLSGQKVLPMVR